MLRKIECYIQPTKLDEVKEGLIEAGIEGMSVTEVLGFGRQRGYLDGETPNKSVKLLPKIKLEIVVGEDDVDKITAAIIKLAGTGCIGSGKIFVLPVEDAIRIRTSESGISAIT
ncbi:MAG: P-II family nitrogen regulator [Actinomycetota bacterium]|jgi:nitrogen regulatory protein P-II 1|nr:P-II family nitrogen regulator [Actinomycetota bacterium]